MSARPPSQAEDLVRAAKEASSLFHDGETSYADIEAGVPMPHHEVLPLRSKAFRTWLSGRYWGAVGRPAGGQALTDAIDVLCAMGRYEGPDRLVAVRIGEHQGAIYLDLGDDRWRVVEIDTAGWRILDRSPIPFRRPRGLASLPTPVPGGSVEELRSFVNVRNDDQFRLVTGWLLAAFRTRGPYIVLLIGGEQGSAKSTTARVLRLLVDPNTVGDRSLPRDEQSMAIAANNSWIASFDNVSMLADWRSDAIARLATGAGFSARQLYSDDEEYLVHVARPVILNGIGSIVTRADLLDRAIVLDLATISDRGRRSEEEFWRAFELARPRLLGALLNAVSVAFGRHEHVHVRPMPRMADATLWVTAAEGQLRWPTGSFVAAYRANIAHRRALTVDANPLARPISMMLGTADRWEGTATELLHTLEQHVDPAVTRRRDWPKTSAALGTALRRLAPDLRTVDFIDVQFPQHHGPSRIISLVRVRESLSQASHNESGRDSGDSDSQSSAALSIDDELDLVAEARRIYGDDLLPMDGGPVVWRSQVPSIG